MVSFVFMFFFFNDTATTEIYTLSLHDALPIWCDEVGGECAVEGGGAHRLDASELEEAGIVDENVRGLANGAEEAVEVRVAANVAGDRRRAQFGREWREPFLVASNQRERGAGAGQGDGYRTSNAARRARDERVTAA